MYVAALLRSRGSVHGQDEQPESRQKEPLVGRRLFGGLRFQVQPSDFNSARLSLKYLQRCSSL